MIKHKFAVGDRVLAVPDASNANVRPGVYTILKALPVEGTRCQYRVKTATDTHERVLDEALLRPVQG